MVTLGKRFDNQNGHSGIPTFFNAAENAVIRHTGKGKSQSFLFTEATTSGSIAHECYHQGMFVFDVATLNDQPNRETAHKPRPQQSRAQQHRAKDSTGEVLLRRQKWTTSPNLSNLVRLGFEGLRGIAHEM